MTAGKTTDGACGSCRYRTMVAPSPALSAWRFVKMSENLPKECCKQSFTSLQELYIWGWSMCQLTCQVQTLSHVKMMVRHH